ncbi:MAG: hypothetical protein KKA73_29255, partial [Chloroflexi bacterium]|nr:hypothetical protein [Chloroflexota bacterium]
YTLEEDDNATFSSPTTLYTGSDTEHAVSGQTTGRWYYRVRATNTIGDGPWSSTQDVGVCPAAPTLYAISNPECDGDYTVDWSSVAGATSYTLEEDDNAAFTSPTVAYSGSDTEHAVSGQTTGRWYYRVRASNAGGDSAWSGTQDVGVCPAAPVLNAVSNPECDGDYTVDWGAVTGAISYTLEEDDNAAFTSPSVVYAGSDTDYAFSGQTTGRWYYRVKATNAIGDSAWSGTQDVGVCPAALTLYAVSNPECDGDYTVDWSTVTGATSYTLEEDDNAAFSSPTTVYSGSDTDHAVSGQSAGVWYYRVRASNAGGSSEWSTPQSVQVCYRVYLPLVARQY